MELQDFYKMRRLYEEKAKKNGEERMNRGDDSPFWSRVLDEMVIDAIDRIEKLEKILEPAPENERE